MALPLLLLAAAFEAASVASNKAGQDEIDKFRRKTFQESRRRTNENYAAAEKARQRSVTDVKTTPQDAVEASKARTDAYQQAQSSTSAVPSLLAPEARGSASVVSEDARQVAKARTLTNAAAVSRGNMEGLGDVFLRAGIGANRNMADIRQFGDFSTSWAQNVVPYQYASAAQEGNDEFMMGDLFQMASQMAMKKGMAGRGGTGTSGTPIQNQGTFAGAPASIPGINGTVNMPGTGSPYDWNNEWAKYGQTMGGGKV